MRIFLKGIVLLFLVIINLIAVAGNSDRAGEAGAYELLINGQARTNGMLGINSASVRGFDSYGTNIAGLAYNKKLSVYANYMSWLTGTETTKAGIGMAFELSPGNNLGFAVDYMSFGKIPLTTTINPGGIGYFSPYMMNLALSYARIFGDGVRAGITGRLINEGISTVSATGFSLDAGLQYTTGEKEDFHFGVFIRNLGFPMKFDGSALIVNSTTPGGTNLPFLQRSASFELPTQFSIAVTKDWFLGRMSSSQIYCKPAHRISLSGNFVYNAFIENWYGLGIEYAFRETFSFRTGYLYETYAFNKEKTTRAHMGLAVGASLDLKVAKKETVNPSVIEISYNYRPSWVFAGTHNLQFAYFLSHDSYCDKLERKTKAVPVEVVQPKPEVKVITKYDTIIQQLPPEVKTVIEYQKVNDILKGLTGNIEFKYNTAILTERGEGAMSVIGELMNKYPNSKYLIEGNTDSDGSEENNMILSKLRAKVVARYLVQYKGIPENNLDVEWYGESRPIATNETPEGKQRNRRVDIKMIESSVEK